MTFRHRSRPPRTSGTAQLRSIGASDHTAGGGADALVARPLARPLTLAELAGEWTHKDSSLTRRIDRDTGAYAGDDSLIVRTTWTITEHGALTSGSFGVHNGMLFVEDAVGRIKLEGNVLHLRLSGGARAKYVVHGWQEGSATTILKLNGPWHGDIPQEVLDAPDAGGSCDQSWYRKAAPPARPR